MDNFRARELQISQLTVERPSQFAAPDEDPPSDLGTPAATETMSTEWTDEKHSMYLKSMEASFVNQLYSSMDSRGWHSQKGSLLLPKSSRQPQFNSRAPSGQFKVFRGGCWQKINFVRAEAEVNKADGSCGDLLENPWVLHFRSSCKTKEVESPIVQVASVSEEVDSIGKKEMPCAPATCSKHFRASHSQSCHQDMVGGNTEVSDQNFVDEDIKEEKTLGSCDAKRMKALILNVANNDQVVPLRKPADT
ncbi:uncharacterized protein LOC110761885 isoform X1 [Prunus avium]|uniref:Uncharacterized protein LOC110761885 isoform X1 n=1 Tax=Prunus avium TaxID=42229 RepID=A0A6P5T1L3_PRUAV|nr:uncharacterized protein LOC110761885 isoform X1 [Prunus avium]